MHHANKFFWLHATFHLFLDDNIGLRDEGNFQICHEKINVNPGMVLIKYGLSIHWVSPLNWDVVNSFLLFNAQLIAEIHITRFWSVALYLYIEPVAGLLKSETRYVFTSHFENMSASCQCDMIAWCDWLFCFTVLFSLAEKKMQFVNKSHH